MHKWGDDDFDWEALFTAHNWIADELKRRRGGTLYSKEKYGTIVYEWIDPSDNHNWHVLVSICLEAAVKWPNLRDAILEDIAADEHLVGEELHREYWK